VRFILFWGVSSMRMPCIEGSCWILLVVCLFERGLLIEDSPRSNLQSSVSSTCVLHQRFQLLNNAVDVISAAVRLASGSVVAALSQAISVS
jgi:hypothetical protein